jgi:hypothetical protein
MIGGTPVKKVRLAIGAVAAAVPAMAMMVTPAANAATPAKYIPQTHRQAAPLTVCGSTSQREADSAKGLFGTIFFTGSCVRYQSAHLAFEKTGLTERIRYRSKGNKILASKFIAGHFQSGGTQWHSSPNIHAYMVCEALVANSNHNKSEYGAVCETT